MVALIHVAVWGLLTTSVESATTLIGDTHSVATNADTAGMNEIEETQHATLDKNFDATPLYMSRKVREMFDSTSKQQRDHGHLFMTLKHKVAAISVRPQVEMDQYRIQHDCSPLNIIVFLPQILRITMIHTQSSESQNLHYLDVVRLK